ncbi:MAG: hypothetical protein HN509_08725, partial [Halobacteriovoraceae bacterium]|nr:hypothetical protein [Halobacteriovoraceae bacterium]
MKRSRVSWVLGTLIVFALTLTVQAGKKDKGLTLLEKLQGHINHTQNGLPAGIKKALSTNQDFPIENDSDRYILCARDEDQYTGMEREIIAPWERAWKKGDFGSFQKLLSKSYKIPRFARPEKVSRSNMGAISEFGWLTSKDRLTTKRQLINQYKKDWKQYKEIIDFSLDTETYLSKRGQRFAPGFLEMKEADLLVRFDLRAIDMKNQRRNDRGTMRVRLIRKNIQSPWKISTYQILKGETLVS